MAKNETTDRGATESASPAAPKREFSITRYFTHTRLDARAFQRLLRAKHPEIRFIGEYKGKSNPHPKRWSVPLGRLDMAHGETWGIAPRLSRHRKALSGIDEFYADRELWMTFTYSPSDSAIDPARPPENVRAYHDGGGVYILRGGRISGNYDAGDLETRKFLSGIVRLVTKIATPVSDLYSPELGRWFRGDKSLIWFGYHVLQWCRDDPVHHWADGRCHPTQDWKFPEGLPWYDPPFGTANDDLSR